jgi:hypothetical protein
MRQVDHDEFTYMVYCGLRKWTHTGRHALFAPLAKRRSDSGISAAKPVVEQLRYLEILSPAAGYADLDADARTALIGAAIDALPGAIGKLWLSGHHPREIEARETAACLIADAFDPFEVLASTSRHKLLKFPAPKRYEHALHPTWP